MRKIITNISNISINIIFPGLLLILLSSCSNNQTTNEASNAVTNQPESNTSSSASTGNDILAKQNCLTCHSLDGTKLAGPTFKGLYNSKKTVIENGKEKEVVASDAYLNESITDPQKQVVKGYPASMPAYSKLSNDEVNQLVEAIKKAK